MNPSDSMNSLARELVGIEVLVVDQDERVHKGITQLLSQAGLHVTCVADPEAAVSNGPRSAGARNHVPFDSSGGPE